MSEYLQENRRAVIMLVVALAVALLGGLYLLLSGGGEEEALAPVPTGQTPAPAATLEPVDDTTAEVVTVVGRGTNANPFGPLVGTEEDAADQTGSSGTDTSTGSTKQNPTNSSDPTTVDSGKSPSTTSVDVSGSSSNEEQKPAKDDKPESVVPEPITKGGDAEDAVPVTVIEVSTDYAVVRVAGHRTKLYVSIPGVQGVTYAAPLGRDCAWLGRVGTDVRVSACVGKTERL